MEVEIKLHVRPEIPGGAAAFFRELRRLTELGGYALGPAESHDIQDTYFDTPDRRLAAAGAGLRLRTEQGVRLITLKLNRSRAGALTRRIEVEESLTQDSLDGTLDRVRHLVGPAPTPVTCFAAGKPCGGLVPVLQVQTARTARSAGGAATLALDRVVYPGLSGASFYDIELESAPGVSAVALIRRLEQALCQMAGSGIAPAAESKLERGLRLLAAAPGAGAARSGPSQKGP